MEASTELIERVSAATGPDREIDWAVLQLCGWRKEVREYDVDTVICRAAVIVKPDGTTFDWKHENEPKPTKSLDAVVALVERELSGWDWGVETTMCGGDNCYAGYVAQKMRIGPEAYGKTPALALLLAFLRAKSALSVASNEAVKDIKMPTPTNAQKPPDFSGGFSI